MSVSCVYITSQLVDHWDIGFVKSAIQYVNVHMNKLLQTQISYVAMKYDHITTVLIKNK
jgi:hypothetical protein